MRELTFSAVRGGDTETLSALYRIYTASIAASERKPREQLAAMLLRPEYRFIVARRDAEVIGFSIIFAAPEDSFALLEYFAVKPTSRGEGIGTQLFRESLSLALEGRDVPVLLEVDTPESRPESDGWRREQFYRQRLGCRKVDGLPYQLPLRVSGQPPRMELLIYFPARPRIVEKAALRRWLATTYRDVYAAPSDDPRIHQMLHAVSDPVRLV